MPRTPKPLLCLLFALLDYADVSGSSASVGDGLYLTLVGSVVATVVAGVLAFRGFRRPMDSPQAGLNN